jgi:predicted ferric reductase
VGPGAAGAVRRRLAIRRFRRPGFPTSGKRSCCPTVTHLKLDRPRGFTFRPGDFLFLKIPALSRFEWHPFTISSAPEQADHLGLHIRGLGNWTRELHERFARIPEEDRRLPVLLHGPYGTPSNEIFRSRIAVLVGAGIGVTPFASILRSLMLRGRADWPWPEKVSTG